MSITLQLEPALEASLREKAAREGLDAGTLVARTLQQQFGNVPASGEAREAELLLRINQGLPEATWQRYHELAHKRDAEALTPAEHSELLSISETIETTDVQRLEYMSELASLRGITLRVVRTQLGIADRKGNGNA